MGWTWTTTSSPGKSHFTGAAASSPLQRESLTGYDAHRESLITSSSRGSKPEEEMARNLYPAEARNLYPAGGNSVGRDAGLDRRRSGGSREGASPLSHSNSPLNHSKGSNGSKGAAEGRGGVVERLVSDGGNGLARVPSGEQNGTSPLR
jgi:hypothetical protein